MRFYSSESNPGNNPMSLRCQRFFGLALLSFLFGCQPTPKAEESEVEAFSNRPQNYDRFIAIVKLQQRPLLTSKRMVADKPITDAILARKINTEQETFVAELNKIAPEAQVLYRYRMVMNGLAIVAPKKYEEMFRQLSGTSYVETERSFQRAAVVQGIKSINTDLEENNSVTHIGAKQYREQFGIDGNGIKVGVIDTGIDYTHKMFGGVGTKDAYHSIDPNILPEDAYANNRVRGGIDLVGTEYDSAAPDFSKHIPISDANPVDESGHGTHVAGTIAGKGDGVKTYTGVAPGVDLYAIKVFGKDGSTGDAVIIAALEYAADPNRDGSLSDQLDVVNLSLGSSYGTPHLLYSEALTNLVDGGTFVVASAGNEGAVPFIVGAPSTTPRALSVAASVDGMDHNWKFLVSEFSFADGKKVPVEAFQATFGKPIAESDQIVAELVHIGLANADLDEATAAKLKGKVAFIDRGQVTFCEKAIRAEKFGAIGFVIGDVAESALSAMGGDCKISIPGIRIEKALADTIRQANNPVVIDFNNGSTVDKPELIDNLAGFSSRGPRSYDGLLKPEIAAPGQNIISAAYGEGDAAASLSGTSMAAPHVAGVVALLKAAHPEWSPAPIKSSIMGTALRIKDAKGIEYATAYQGAGRIQVSPSGAATLATSPEAISLGIIQIPQTTVIDRVVQLKNHSSIAQELMLSSRNESGLTIEVPSKVIVPASGVAWLRVRIQIDVNKSQNEREGLVVLTSEDGKAHTLPVFALTESRSQLVLNSASIKNGEVAVQLSNHGRVAGEALLFSLLAKDEKKSGLRINPFRNGICDLAAVGYRIRSEQNEKGESQDYLEIAAKTFDAVSNWHLCELSVQFDTNKDGETDLELIGAPMQRITNNAAQAINLFSILADAKQMFTIRKNLEANWPNARTADYSPAVIDIQDLVAPGFSSIVVLKVALKNLGIHDRAAQDLHLKVALQVATEAASPEQDDFLADHGKAWGKISLPGNLQELPLKAVVAPGGASTIHGKLLKDEKLMLLLPQNPLGNELSASDQQLIIIN